jgi:hypothetical protein
MYLAASVVALVALVVFVVGWRGQAGAVSGSRG